MPAKEKVSPPETTPERVAWVATLKEGDKVLVQNYRGEYYYDVVKTSNWSSRMVGTKFLKDDGLVREPWDKESETWVLQETDEVMVGAKYYWRWRAAQDKLNALHGGLSDKVMKARSKMYEWSPETLDALEKFFDVIGMPEIKWNKNGSELY